MDLASITSPMITKVVKLVADSNNLLHACVYSLKANSWRWICDLNYHINRSLPGVKRRVILAFDIVTQEFREMTFPDEKCPNSVVGSLNGRLCVFSRSYDLRDDIWVMNEYGVASSWTRIRISLMKPMCSTKNSDEVLLALDKDMCFDQQSTLSRTNLAKEIIIIIIIYTQFFIDI